MSKRLPEYTQEEINMLFADFILKNARTDCISNAYNMLERISNDNYILVNQEEQK